MTAEIFDAVAISISPDGYGKYNVLKVYTFENKIVDTEEVALHRSLSYAVRDGGNALTMIGHDIPRGKYEFSTLPKERVKLT